MLNVCTVNSKIVKVIVTYPQICTTRDTSIQFLKNGWKPPKAVSYQAYLSSVECNDGVTVAIIILSLVKGSDSCLQVLKSYHSEQIKEQGRFLPFSIVSKPFQLNRPIATLFSCFPCTTLHLWSNWKVKQWETDEFAVYFDPPWRVINDPEIMYTLWEICLEISVNNVVFLNIKSCASKPLLANYMGYFRVHIFRCWCTDCIV